MGGAMILPAIIFLPLVGAAAIALIAPSRSIALKPVAVATSAATGALTLWLMAAFEKNDGDFQFTQLTEWIGSAGISWHVGVDGISLFLVVLTGLLFPIAIVACDPPHDAKAYYIWMLVLETGCLGVFLSLDLVLFFLFFEIVLIPMYFLIGTWGHENRKYAATKFFLFTMLGSALMLVGMLALALLTAQETGNAVTFNLLELANSAGELPTITARWIFLSFVLAFAVKVPLFPVHTWLPDAHTEAPTAGSVILAGVLLKLGTYGLVRFGLYLFPEASHYFAPLLFTLGVIGILYGAVVATMQRDLKRLVAYSSVAHLGFIVLGIFSINTEGIEGGLLQMVNHGLSTGALFLLVGFIYERRHTQADLRDGRASEGSSGAGRGVHRGDAFVGGAARPQRIRGRVLDPRRSFCGPPLVGGGGCCRGHTWLRCICFGPTSGCFTAPPTTPTGRCPISTGRRSW